MLILIKIILILFRIFSRIKVYNSNKIFRELIVIITVNHNKIPINHNKLSNSKKNLLLSNKILPHKEEVAKKKY
jgi:hypothetical protein